MDEFLRFLITPLLLQPSDLEITVNQSSIFLKVSQVDTGRVIGKHGTVINYLRTLLKTYCLLHNIPQATLPLSAPPKN